MLRLIGAAVDEGKYQMVSPWMYENIVEFLEENPEKNPLKLVRPVFHFAHDVADIGTS